ncbi:mechanosensitive ion channel family protein [Tropicibacter oceani]|uniref:Small-conductance mechanosensitive channel n=1 Tax=Tropicibacter oceani TaxID=3058420 RepID=A0ABY8QCB8_9RHOB|nr:mechanosensitive ion channel family protein [Tropicibacter oceani]WGW02261.1 mechanosensitive ion channel family protein [Tropicibacter oceani]
MPRQILAALLFLAMLAASPLPAQETATETAPEEEVIDTQQTVSVQGGVRDDQIEARLRNILEASGWYSDVMVEVEDGIVFLDGTTDSTKRQDWVRDLAAKTDGVVAVVNRIRVNQQVSFTLAPAFTELRHLRDQAIAAAPSVVVAVLILPLAFFLSSLVARLAGWGLRDRIKTPILRDITVRLIALPVFLVGLYIVLQVAGLTQLAVSLIGGAGIVGIVIGFAFREIAENFLASLLLSLRQPFRRGDYVEVAGYQGVVHSMNTRSTVLVSPEGNHIQIPNATVFKSTIENYTASASRRGSFGVGIGYDAAISDAQDVIMRVLMEHEAVSNDPEPMVLANGLGDSTVDITVYYWFDGTKYSPLKLRSALIRRVKKEMMEAGISMPDAAREIIFPEGIPLPMARPAKPGPAPKLAPPPETVAEPEISHAEDDLSNEVQELEDQMAARVEGDKEDDLLDG